MAKARILAVVIIGVLLLSAFMPGSAMAAPPTQPTNLTPADGTVDIMLMPTLTCNYTEPIQPQLASWWQISVDNQTTADGSYVSSVFDTGITTASLTELAIPRGYLLPTTKYYWHVKVQDEPGYWSAWSVQTSFTTVKSFRPDKPENISPANGADQISPSHTFKSTAYYDADSDPFYAMEAQISGEVINWATPLWDSGPLNSQTWTYPVGVLEYGSKYYWRVRYQDDTGLWSDWSDETSLTTITNSPPNQPSNVEPVDLAKDVSVTPTLKSSDFSDPNASAYVSLNDTHAASRWQVTKAKGDYSDAQRVYDSDNTTTGLTQIVVPAGSLSANTTYYWHVRYQDSYGNWSAYSAETAFTTKSLSLPTAGFTSDKTEVTAEEQAVTFTDNSTPAGEITAWFWDFGDGTTENWTLRDKPATGKISHMYTASGTYTASLKVSNAQGENTAEKDIVVHATPKAVFLATPATPKAGTDVTFADGSTGDITKWTWEFGDGSDLVQWDKAARDAADGKIKHVFKKAGTYVATLTVSGTFEGKDVTSTKNVEVKVSGPSGFHFGLWMIGVAVAVIVVIACVLYLLRARRAK